METKINQSILQKANKIIQDKKDNKKYLKKCKKANICPICGEKIIHKTLTKKEHKEIDEIKICSKDESHYRKVFIFDNDWPYGW